MSGFHGHLGVWPLAEQGYQFAVWAPHAQSMAVVGEFNDWSDSAHPMQQTEDGIWWCDCPDARNGQQYQFAMKDYHGNKQQKNDPRARLLTHSDGNSIIYDDDHDWQSHDFVPAPIHQQVIYELHIGTFAKPDADTAGTFATAIDKLDELHDMGITCIELMPVNEFAGDTSWGYNPAYPFAVETAYGGPEGLKQLVDAAHQRGMSVILDVVYNHLGPSDLDIWQFDGWHENNKGGIYFYNDYRSATPWGDTRPDYGRPEVRQYFIDNALMWLNEYRLDGLRMDMVPYMRSVSGVDDGSDDIEEAYTLIRQLNEHIHSQCANKLTLAEDLHSHHFITDALPDGCGYTAQWDAGFVHPVRQTLTAGDDNTVALEPVEQAVLHTYSGRPFSRVIYTESHDEVANGRARVVEEVAPGNVDEDFFAHHKGMLAAALVMTSCGIPMLFQGQEFKQHGWFDDEHDLDWERKEQFGHYVEGFRRLIALRTNQQHTSAGLTGALTEVVHRDPQHKVLGYVRRNEADDQPVWVYLCLANQQVAEYQLHGLPSQPQCLFAWQQGQPTEITPDEGRVTLEPYSIFIFGAG